jgi:hypothetical protein
MIWINPNSNKLMVYFFDLADIDPERHTKIRANLLWDVNLENFDYFKSSQLVVERVVQRGEIDDWLTIFNLYGEHGVREKIKLIPYLNPKDMNFVHKIFDIPLNDLKSYVKSQEGPQYYSS